MYIYITARKTIFSFSKRPEKMVFPKKSRCNLIFLVLLGNMIFLFPENMMLPPDGKWKLIFLKKIHGNMIFSSNVLKRWSFQKGPSRDMIFLVLPRKIILSIWYVLRLLPKKIKDDPIPQKCTERGLTFQIATLERAPAILCIFMENFTDVFIYCYSTKKPQET